MAPVHRQLSSFNQSQLNDQLQSACIYLASPQANTKLINSNVTTGFNKHIDALAKQQVNIQERTPMSLTRFD